MCALTIVTPHFNDIEGLKRNIIFIDDAKPEVLDKYFIIDDGSIVDVVDELKTLMERSKYLQNILYIIQLKKNKGANFCRRLGLMKSSTEYVMFLDSDDKLSNNFFKNISEHIFKAKSDIIFNSVNYYKNNNLFMRINPLLDIKTILKRPPSFIGSSFLFSDNFLGVGIQTSSWIIRRKTIMPYFWKLGLRGHQDWFFLMKYFEKNSCAKILYLDKAYVERHVYKGRDHISKRLDYKYSISFLKENRELFSNSTSFFYFTSVVAIKYIKCGSVWNKIFGFWLFSFNLFRLPFWKYIYARIVK